MFYTPTADPDADFAEWDARQDAAEAAGTAEHTRLSDAFVSAAARGEEEPLEKESVGLALYAVAMDKPELLEAFFYWAARQADNPVLRAMVRAVADAWAEIQMRETRA